MKIKKLLIVLQNKFEKICLKRKRKILIFKKLVLINKQYFFIYS